METSTAFEEATPEVASLLSTNPNILYQEDFEGTSFFPLSGTTANKTHGIENCNDNSISLTGPNPWTLTSANKTGRFELRKGILTTKLDYRSEVTIIKGTEDTRFMPEMWYSYNVMIPKIGGEPCYRKSINQWYEDGSNELTTRMENGFVYLELQNGGTTRRWDLFSDKVNGASNTGFTPYPVDEWHQFVFHINHSLYADGFIEIFRDGQKIHSYNGPTIHLRLPKWKLGLYASQKSLALVEIIHFDNIRVGNKYVTLQDMTGGAAPSTTPNTPPTAAAGADLSVQLPLNTATLVGSGKDADGTIASYKWTKVSGPTGGSISSPSTASTGITGLTEGIFLYRLTVTDNSGASASDDVQVTVLKSTTNSLPVVNAGIDQSITLPTSSATLKATATDSDGSIASMQWTKVSGPAASISGATTLTPSVVGLVEGTYIFRFTATDNSGASASDDVQVIVQPVPVTTGGPAVTSMTIINASTEKDVLTVTNGGTYSLSQLGITKMNIRANASTSTSRVKFELSGQQIKTTTDKAAPFALMGDDSNGNYYYGSWGPPPVGTYTLKATPINSLGIAGTPVTVTFTIIK